MHPTTVRLTLRLAFFTWWGFKNFIKYWMDENDKIDRFQIVSIPKQFNPFRVGGW